MVNSIPSSRQAGHRRTNTHGRPRPSGTQTYEHTALPIRASFAVDGPVDASFAVDGPVDTRIFLILSYHIKISRFSPYMIQPFANFISALILLN